MSDEKQLVNYDHYKDLLDVYPEELVDSLIEKKEKLEKISNMMNNTTRSVSKASGVMVCNITKCPYKNHCILKKEGIAPEGYSCPIEKKMILEMESSIVQELDIDEQSTMEMELLYDFIDAKLIDLRASSALATDGIVQIIEEKHKSHTNTSKEISPEFTIKVELKKMKNEILDQFLATRRARKKYGLQSQSTIEQMIRNAQKNKVNE